MRDILEQPKKKLWIGIAISMLLLTILGCSLGDFLPGFQATLTTMPTSSPSLTPWPSTSTFTSTPTAQGLVLATTKPTLRPSWTQQPTKTLRPTWTASPTLSPTATSEVGFLFSESFDDPANTWLKKKGGNWAMGNAGKKYFMSVDEPMVEITSARSYIKLDEVRIEADITHNNGSGYYGFNCRESAGGDYYTIFVTTDGYYGFGENRNEKLTIIESGRLPTDPKIDPKGTNRVRADCRGNALTLFINGVAIDRTTVPGLGVGYVGMMIGTRLEDERLTVYYDNLVIYAPVQTPVPTDE